MCVPLQVPIQCSTAGHATWLFSLLFSDVVLLPVGLATAFVIDSCLEKSRKVPPPTPRPPPPPPRPCANPPPPPPVGEGPNKSAKFGKVAKNQNFGCSTA